MRKKSVLLGFAFLLAVTLSGCATTEMTSQVNPDYRGRHFNKVLVEGMFPDLKSNQIAEAEFYERLRKETTCEIVKYSDLFFYGQPYSKKEIAVRIADQRIDCILYFQPVSSGTTASYVPPTTVTTEQTKREGHKKEKTYVTSTTGGYNVYKPWAKYEVRLMTLDSRNVWFGSASTGGTENTNGAMMIRSAVGETVKKIVADGVLK